MLSRDERQALLKSVANVLNKALAAVRARIDAQDVKIAAIPLIKGEPGPPGKDAEPVDVAALERSIWTKLHASMTELLLKEVGAAVERIPIPVNGEPGAPGKPGLDGASVHPDTVRLMVIEETQKVFAALPRPEPVINTVVNEPSPELIRGIVVAEVQKAIATIPKPQDGAPGTPGAPGKDAVLDMDALYAFAEQDIAARFAALPRARDGKDADMELVAGMVNSAVAEAMNNLPKAVSADVIREIAMAEISKAVDAIPRPKDGKDAEPIHPDTVALMIAREVEKAILAMPKPIDGKPGKDAWQVELVPSLDKSKSYPRGTWVKHRGGILAARRNIDPVEGDLDRAGWDVVLNGIAESMIEQSDDGRTVTARLVMTDGQVTEVALNFPVFIYRGIYETSSQYKRGDAVTYGGSLWHCNTDNTQITPRQENKDWQLMARRGRDGKDGLNGKDAPGPVKLNGKE